MRAVRPFIQSTQHEFPEAPKFIRRNRTVVDGKTVEAPKEDFSYLVNSHLIGQGRRYINRLVHDEGADVPSFEDLAEHLEQIIWDNGAAQSPYEARMNGKEYGKLHDPTRVAESAAQYVLETYDADFIPRIREHARKGGQNSKRGRTFTLEAYAAVRHLSQSKAAKALGCHVTTIRRLAKDWDAQQQSMTVVANPR